MKIVPFKQYGAETESWLSSASQDKAEHHLGTLKGWDSVVCGVTRYELHVSGITILWGLKFAVPFQTRPLGLSSLPYNA